MTTIPKGTRVTVPLIGVLVDKLSDNTSTAVVRFPGMTEVTCVHRSKITIENPPEPTELGTVVRCGFATHMVAIHGRAGEWICVENIRSAPWAEICDKARESGFGVPVELTPKGE